MARWQTAGLVCGLVFVASTSAAARGSVDGSRSGDTAALARAHLDLGRLHYERAFRALDQAIAEYEQAVRAQPDHADAQYHLGLAYHTKAKLQRDDKPLYRKAMSAYRRYLLGEPAGRLVRRARQNLRVIRARLR